MKRRPSRPLAAAMTLLELVTAVIIGTVFITLVLRWGLGVSVVATQATINDANGDLILATDLFEADLLTAVPCGTLGSTIREVGDDNVVFTADLQGDGVLEEVSWRIDGVALQRAVTALDGCAPDGAPSYATIADDVTGWIFPVAEGAIRDGAGWRSVCVNALSANCTIPAFTMHLEREDRGGWSEITATVGPR